MLLQQVANNCFFLNLCTSGQGEMSLVPNFTSYNRMINNIQISCNFVTLHLLFGDNIIHTAQKVGSA